MTPTAIGAFLVTATILTMVPGLDTAIVLRAATRQGARHGMATALGIAIGCFCWGTAAAFGLGAILARWPLLFDMLRWAGAGYLAWLGGKLLFTPRHMAATDGPASAGEASLARSLRRGFTTNALNPKVGLFYLTLLPQFVPHDAPDGSPAFRLAIIHVGIALGWFVLLAILSGAVRPWLQRPRTIAVMDYVTGGLFVLLGLQTAIFANLHA
jgi:threonine/homoserine/homoserine lactone efflux protein